MTDTLRLLFVGDVMLGRLVDASFPTHNYSSKEDESHARQMKQSRSSNKSNPYTAIWGNTLDIFHEADVRFINLETSVTTHSTPWPNKAFNYRMHPNNIKALNEAHIDFANTANNHILDYGYEGMKETVETLTKAIIGWAGVGDNLIEAGLPCIIEVNGLKIGVIGAADHYSYWASNSKPGINYVDIEGELNVFGTESISMYSTNNFIERTKNTIRELKDSNAVDLCIVSIHIGANYAWEPTSNQQRFVKELIDKAGVDVIHGHSSHHIKGIEIYKGKVIMYGCGDFISDYMIDREYKNNLGFIYELVYDMSNKQFIRLELTPTVISNLQVNIAVDDNRSWLYKKMDYLCDKLGTQTNISQGEDDRLIISLI